jgi:RimJ/RimL family protein N-acetyltransferase
MSAPESSSPLQWLGNWVPIRSLGRRHRQRIGEHLLALTPSDRYLRFGHAIGDGQITRYAQTLDFERDELFGVFNRRLQVIAMAHLAYPRAGSSDWQDTAEFGVSVLDRYRGRGFGSRLFQLCCLHARNRQMRYLLIHALTENQAMLRIAERAGAWREAVEVGNVTSRLHLPDDSWLSHVEETMETQLGELDFRIKMQAKQVRDFVDSVQVEVKDWLGDSSDGDDDPPPPTDPAT